MSSSELCLLIVDDDQDDILLFRDCVREAIRDVAFHVEDASTPARALESLAGRHYDVIVIDYRLGPESGLDLLRTIRSRGLDHPVLLLTGVGDEQVAVEALKAGATDYLVKSTLTPSLIGSAIRYAVELSRKEAQSRQAEVALRESEARYRLLVENVDEIIYEVAVDVGDTMQGQVRFVSGQAKRILGYDAEEFVTNPQLWSQLLHPDDFPAVVEATSLILKDRRTGTREYRMRHKLTGKYHWMEDKVTPFFDRNGSAVTLRGVARDITERRNLEVQLRQSQKMEAVGQLAGGVAHDFNNLLTAILGYSYLLETQLGGNQPLLEEVAEIKKAGERAAALTRQLLIFSRKQVLIPEVLALNAVVTNLDKMLRRVIGEDIDLTLALAPGIGRVKADPGQIEQVIMNLAVNARDAMPTGGKLTIETHNADLDESYVREHVTVRPGPYVMLAVSDTGAGMDAETLSHIFEPFFTTKAEGKGTGLGLATVYGIVKQSAGHISVYSELGKGTAFKIYLPRVDGQIEARGAGARAPEANLRGSETILLVEDEESVRRIARGLLEKLGYTVLVAADPQAALDTLERHPGHIHVLLSDVVMPGMSGPDIARLAVAHRPDLKVLYISGYTEDAAVLHGVIQSGAAYLQKPFTPDNLARKLREVLDAAP